MGKIIYHKGQIFEGTRLSFLEETDEIKANQRRAKFLCICGNTVELNISWVKSLNTKSCGCLKKEKVAAKNTKHLNAKRKGCTGAYRSFQAMHQRVKVNENYKNIFVCERWCGDYGFENFLEDMGERPENHSIDRINNNGNYEPNNCRWATQLEQAQNTSLVKLITIDGETLSINGWCRKLGIKYSMVKQRMQKGMSVEEAIIKPVDKSKQRIKK